MSMKGYRTIVFNISSLFVFWALLQDWIIPVEYRMQALALHTAVFSVCNVGLRTITNTAVGKKE